MSDEKIEKKGVLRFEEGMKPFMCFGGEEGLKHVEELAVDIYLDEEDIGYINKEGKVTISGHVTEQDPSRIMSYSNTFTSEQWDEISGKKNEFKEKCRVREMVFRSVLERLENLASKMFPESGVFDRLEIVKLGHKHIVLGGGKGEYETYLPGIYIYDDIHYPNGEVNIGYRPVFERRITSAICLSDELLSEVLKVVSSIDTFEG